MRARQKVSRAGVELIKSFEGLRQAAARLPDGRWTLGYGHTFSAREGARVTQEDADALLRFDLLPIVDSLNNMVLVPLNQNQFDALVSFSFNIGIENFGSSSVLKRINEGRMTEAALAMDAWRSAEFNGQTYVLAPLIRRRAAEKNLFLTPEETAGNAPSLLVRPLADVEADASAQRPSELDAPDRGGVLSAYPSGQPQGAAAFVPEPPASQPVFQSMAPQPVAPQIATPYPVASQTTPIVPEAVAPEPVVPEPVAPEPVAPIPVAPAAVQSSPLLSPYAASTYVSEVAPTALPLSPYAGVYTPPAPPPVMPQPVTPEPVVHEPVAVAPQPEFVAPPVAPPAAVVPSLAAYDRQFIDLTSITPRPLPEAAPAPAAPEPPAPQPILRPSDISPYPPSASPYISPYAQPAPQPVTPQPVAPQTFAPQAFAPQTFAPQAFTPQPAAFAPSPVAPAEPPVVEVLPGGFAAPSQIRETPVQAPEPAAPTTFDPAFGSAMMSPEVAAALARAQAEQKQRDEAERLAHQAAARATEEARIRELQRLEAERLEQQRQEQDRIERARFEAERQAREQAEAARIEQARLDAAHLETVRLEAERAEQARQEQARQEQARLEQARLEQARLEQDRLERERAEQARLEAERLEQGRVEAERAEQARQDQAKLEQQRVEQQRQAAAAAPPTFAPAVATTPDAEAEKARKAEAAAALMRLYSPYGGGPLGRPLGFGPAPITQANLTPGPQSQSTDTATDPKPVAPQAAEPEPEAAKRPVEQFVAQNVITPATSAPSVVAPEPEADDSIPLFSTRIETRNDEDDDVGDFRPFTPIMSAANMPAPIVTALNPYASPLPQAAVREPTETVVEVPRPEPVVIAPVAVAAQAQFNKAEPAVAEAVRSDEGLHWRDRLQRPLPADHQPTAPETVASEFVAPERTASERQASLLPKAAYAGDYDDSHATGEDWLHDGRIAMSSEEMEAHSVSWWRMLLSTFWWIMLSLIGIISLGVAAGAYYKSRDLSVIRNGLQQDMEAVSIVTAVIGFVLVSTSMWLMMRRLGGLKEN